MTARRVRDTLHLTNGLSAVALMREAGIEGTIVPWQDVLHEGPVPTGLGGAALRERRADFLGSWGGPGPTRDQIARQLAERDAILDAAAGTPPAPREGPFDEIVLWFEHDLYDQLQLIQILDRLPVDGPPLVTAVQTTTYLGLEPASRYPELYAGRKPVTSAERLAARDAWDAFRSRDPRAIEAVLPRVTALPHLGAALRRHLEQFPSIANGLSRTEQQTLETVADGLQRMRDVFSRACIDREEAFFMGDTGFASHISSLITSPRPLLSCAGPPEFSFAGDGESASGGTLSLTTDGARVLAGEADRVQLCGIDRWLGGVHVIGRDAVWRWDDGSSKMRFA